MDAEAVLEAVKNIFAYRTYICWRANHPDATLAEREEEYHGFDVKDFEKKYQLEIKGVEYKEDR